MGAQIIELPTARAPGDIQRHLCGRIEASEAQDANRMIGLMKSENEARNFVKRLASRRPAGERRGTPCPWRLAEDLVGLLHPIASNIGELEMLADAAYRLFCLHNGHKGLTRVDGYVAACALQIRAHGRQVIVRATGLEGTRLVNLRIANEGLLRYRDRQTR